MTRMNTDYKDEEEGFSGESAITISDLEDSAEAGNAQDDKDNSLYSKFCTKISELEK